MGRICSCKSRWPRPSSENLDFYTHEGLDTLRDITYTDIMTQPYSSDPQQFQSLHLPLKTLQSQMHLLTDKVMAHQLNSSWEGVQGNFDDIPPDIFLMDGIDDEPVIMHIVSHFTLNAEQEHAFHIVAYHTLN